MDVVVISQFIVLAAAASVTVIESIYDFYQSRISVKVREATAKMENYVNLELMNEYDRQKANETKELMEEIFGKPVQKQIRKLGQEERVAKLCEFTLRVAELYGVAIDKISFDESNDNSLVCGAYQKDNKEIILNQAYILSDNWIIQREMLDTIIHECRHAVQFSVLDQIAQLCEKETENPWHISKERANRWLRHYMDYAEACKIPMEYSANQLEVDARTFAYICMEGV